MIYVNEFYSKNFRNPTHSDLLVLSLLSGKASCHLDFWIFCTIASVVIELQLHISDVREFVGHF